MTFQEIIATLNRYWSEQGCLIQQPYDIEVGAGTFNPATSLRALGPEPYRVAYVEPSRRPTDGRYGENPYRLGHYYQYQVLVKPAPPNSQELYLGSLDALGLDPRKNDFRFVEDDWESPTLGASGLGWEVWCNGAEVTQYTYFQQIGSIETDPICVELTYGLERLAMYLQGVPSLFDVQWNDELTYGDVHYQTEVEYSRYYLETSTTDRLFRWFEDYEQECLHCVSKGLVFPGLDYVLKASHAFNMLDARGAISVTERVGYIARVRNLARRVARAYVDQREELGHPLLNRWCEDSVEAQLPIQPASEPTSERADVLFEIGCEEIPAGYIEPALEQMRQKAAAWLEEQRLAYESLCAMATPRRLTLAIRNVETRQSDVETEVSGPSVRAAYDAEGRPTRAAEGFARGQGVDVGALFTKTTDKGTYVFARKTARGRLTGDLLAEFLPRLVTELRFPKTMRWENSRFARPIRWMVALLGDEVVDFAFDRIRSGRTTRGHRFLGSDSIPLANANLGDYIARLRDNAVLVDPQERKSRIREAVEKEMVGLGAVNRVDDDLLDQVTYLVENPRAVVGTFSESHLTVPAEVLATSMKKHQRYFPVYNSDGSLQARFIAISNGTDDGEANVRYGNERVLRARLEDAAFFWKEDQREPFGNRVERLKRVTFQERLGTLYDKTERVKRLAAEIAREFGCDDSKAVRAAELCKADLTTLMVYEFPELQGVMGRYYAANSGESDDVARAIEEHYLPTSAESSLPTTRLGSVVSIADKLDTIVGYFGIGLTPTGSQDPFSLRRQAIGVCRILLNESCRLSLDATIGSAVAAHGEIVAPDTGGRVRAFFRARLAVIFEERGYAYDDVDAVLSAGFEVLSDIPARLEALRAFRASEEFRRAYPAFNRLLRILPPGDFKSPRQDLMRENAEINLRTVLKLLRVTLDTCVIERDYAGLLRTLSQLQPCIDAFFDDVLVMDNDLEVRENRLALLKSIASYLLKVADFSKLVIAGV